MGERLSGLALCAAKLATARFIPVELGLFVGYLPI